MSGRQFKLMCAAIVLWASAIGGVGIVGWQTWMFLRHGDWITFRATDLLFRLTDNQWFLSPTSWLGVQQILDWIPAGIFVPAAGALLAAMIASLGER